MNKQEILDRIEPLFFENAFSEVSMDDLAAALAIKKASIYYHFESKESLFSALLERSFERHSVAFASVLAESGERPRELLERVALLPSASKNLFSVVSQRGYCRIPALRARILELEAEAMSRFHAFLYERYGFSEVRSTSLFLLLDAIAKRICLRECRDDRLGAMLDDAVECFFSRK